MDSNVCIATASFPICFRNGVVSGVGMVATGFPSLLALVALVGFVVVQAVLRFGA
jgi:hypothetical protein